MMATDCNGQVLVVFFGLTASGKSYLSKAWAARHRFPRFNTDVVRKECFGRQQELRQGEAGLDKGLYTPEFSRLTYERLLLLAEQAYAEHPGCPVVLDGSYRLACERQKLVARFPETAVFFIFCCCSETVARARLQERQQDSVAISDGTLAVYRYQRATFEQPGEIAASRLLELDTDASLEHLMQRLDRFLGDAGCPSFTICKAGRCS